VAGVVNFYGGTILYEADKIPTKRLLGCSTPSDPSTQCHTAARHASPFTQVAANNTPLLIFHGEDDTTVPLNASMRFKAELERVGASSTLVVVPGVGHDFDLVACGQTDGLSNEEHLYRWINSTLSPTTPCDSVFCGGSTVVGDTQALYNNADAFLSPYCLDIRTLGSTPDGDDP